ncbi:ABC-three component system protein [Variovorax beijingensis]|uniref:ABC-three component system protein n=1 Tax=Variovorax beijingensis TaxID=2496117 RepID=UPI0039655FFE
MLLLDADLRKYDERLHAEWELQHAQVCDELGPDATETAMAQAGRAILKRSEEQRTARTCTSSTPHTTGGNRSSNLSSVIG